MSQLVLDRNARLLLQAKAHHLDPVVLLGGNGLTEAVIKEVDRALTAHGLIKVKVPSDDREERTAIFEELADQTRRRQDYPDRQAFGLVPSDS